VVACGAVRSAARPALIPSNVLERGRTYSCSPRWWARAEVSSRRQQESSQLPEP